jgi:signal transduction histidine kinase/CheY-like chemotaxis protein
MSEPRLPFRQDAISFELMHSTTRILIFTTAAIYVTWHMIATLFFSEIFSPQIWAVSLWMAAVVFVSLRLLPSQFSFAQAVFLLGLWSAIFLAYGLFEYPMILLLLIFLPLIAIVTIGLPGALLVVSGVAVGLYGLPGAGFVSDVPPSYGVAVILGSLFTGFFGWALSNNLLEAIASSSYHFHQARRLLDETRHNQAEISRMLKDQHHANYQLEKLNQMLAYARKRAEEARDDRDRFILAVSHELRSPLNFIIGFSDLMVNSPETYAPREQWPAGLYEDIQEIYHSSTHLLSLINDILDLGKIDAHSMTLHREITSLDDIIAEVHDMTRPFFIQKGLSLTLQIADDLPQVYLDRTRIRQVFLNLINNALRFTEQGGVTITAHLADDQILVQVIDTGSGIAPEDLPKVFEEFRQVGMVNWQRREGSGLGLAISRRFIQLHGGRIGVESQPGQGTTIHFSLPVLSSLESEEALSHASHATQFVQDRRTGAPPVLLLSGDPLAQREIQALLEDVQVLNADHPDAVQALISRAYPRAVLIDASCWSIEDVQLGEMPYNLPVVAYRLREDAINPPPGIIRYLIKPIFKQTLVEALGDLGSDAQTILVVDDDSAMIRFITQILRSVEPGELPVPDYRLLTAETGAQALEIIKTETLHGLLLDLDLPDISGWDLLAQIRKDEAMTDLPIIVISAADPPQALNGNGREVFTLRMKRLLAPQELGALLNELLARVPPEYPRR